MCSLEKTKVVTAGHKKEDIFQLGKVLLSAFKRAQTDFKFKQPLMKSLTMRQTSLCVCFLKLSRLKIQSRPFCLHSYKQSLRHLRALNRCCIKQLPINVGLQLLILNFFVQQHKRGLTPPALKVHTSSLTTVTYRPIWRKQNDTASLKSWIL